MTNPAVDGDGSDFYARPRPARLTLLQLHSRRVRSTCALIVAATAVLSTTGCAVTTGTPSGPRTASNVVVPLEIVHEGAAILAIVPVKVDGKGPYPFVLDTGASTSGINAALARQLDLPKTGGSSTVSGVVSSSQVPLVRVANWSVGGVTLHPTTIGALTFGSSSTASGVTASTSHIAGLLGSDQLNRFGSITLDYDHQQLRFTPKGSE